MEIDDRWGLVILAAVPIAFYVASLSDSGFVPIGFDTFYHIKYATAIIQEGRVITQNPYFPQDPLAYPIGSHLILADLSILSGESVTTVIVLSPLFLGILILFAFYSFARRFLEIKYSILASLLFYSASTVPAPEIAVNGATIENSLIFPYISVLMGIFLLYSLLLVLSLDNRSLVVDIFAGLIFGTVVLVFHLLALAIFLILIAFTLCSHSIGQLRRSSIVLSIATIWSLPYWSHIVRSGLPTESGAFSTYAQVNLFPGSTGADYLTILSYPVILLLGLGLLFLLLGKMHLNLETLKERKNTLLLAIIVTLLLLSQAWRVGFVLVNDLFVYYLIGGASIVGVVALGKAVQMLQRNDLQKVVVLLVVLVLVASPVFAFFSMMGFGYSETNAYAPVVSWLDQHASGKVVVSDPNSAYLLSSITNIHPLAILPTVSDYYVSDLNSRLQATENIFGTSWISSLSSLEQYNVTYILSEYPQPVNSIISSPYVTPVFPVSSCYHGSSASYDFDYDGIAESFDKFPSGFSQSYLLNNSQLLNTLTFTYLFHPLTYGPIQVYINGTLIQELYGVKRGVWQTDQITLPNSLVGHVEDVHVVNLDPANEWYLEEIGIGNSSQCDQVPGQFRIFTWLKMSDGNVGNYQAKSLDNVSVYNTATWNGGSTSTVIWAYSNQAYNMSITDLYDLKGTQGPELVYANNQFLGALCIPNTYSQGKWLVQSIQIPPSVLANGWNTITFTNFDQANDWYVSHIRLLPISTDVAQFSPAIIMPNESSTVYLAWVANSTKAFLSVNDLFFQTVAGPILVYANNQYVGYFAVNNKSGSIGAQWQYLSLPTGDLQTSNEISFYNPGKSPWIFDDPQITNVIGNPSTKPSANLGMYNFSGSSADFDNDGIPETFYAVPWNGGSASALLYADTANYNSLMVRDLFHPAGTIGPVVAYVNGVRIGSIEALDPSQRGIWRTDSFTIPNGLLVIGWNNVTFVNQDSANQWELASTWLSP